MVCDRSARGLQDAGKGKCRGSVGWDSDKLRAVFEKFNNVIYITGHLHYGTSAYNYEDCGAFKAVNVPTVGVLNHGECSVNSQGFIFSVYEDRIIIRARAFADGEYIECVDNSVINIEIG